MKIVKNPDEKVFEELSEKVKANGGYCPCAILKNKDTRCMCKEFLESQELGLCHCGRYLKQEI